MSLQPCQVDKVGQPASPTRPSKHSKKGTFLARQSKENKYYFNNSYLKKNASNSKKKENYSYHSRKGLSKSKNSHLQAKNKKRSSQGLDRVTRKEELKLGGPIKGAYARQFLFLSKGTSKTFLKDGQNALNISRRKKRTSLQNKTGGRVHTEKVPNEHVLAAKFINLNSQMKAKFNTKPKKRSHIFYETENSFLARIWPDKKKPKKESIYETMAKHNRRQKKLRQPQESAKEKRKRRQPEERRKQVTVEADIPKVGGQTSRFKKLNGQFATKETSPKQFLKVRDPKGLRSSKHENRKSPTNMFKYSLNGFINSNRFVKNYRAKERGSAGMRKHVELLNKIAVGRRRDTKRSKFNQSPKMPKESGHWTIFSRTRIIYIRLLRKLGHRSGRRIRRKS